MRTIDKILEYKLIPLEIHSLESAWIINGCWAKWWQSFDEILKFNISEIPWFDEKESTDLYEDIRYICFEHDIDYRFQKWFCKSNYKFARKIYKLLTLCKAWRVKRRWAFDVALIAFTLLQKFWKKAYLVNK